MLNRKGEVIGVSFAQYRALDAENLNFAIPSKYLKTLLSLSDTAKTLEENNVFISADTYFRRGYAKDEVGDYRGAIADYTEVIRLQPDHVKAYFNRGNAKDELGDYRGAIADYTEGYPATTRCCRCLQQSGSCEGQVGTTLCCHHRL